jgi:hypothetical protein
LFKSIAAYEQEAGTLQYRVLALIVMLYGLCALTQRSSITSNGKPSRMGRATSVLDNSYKWK